MKSSFILIGAFLYTCTTLISANSVQLSDSELLKKFERKLRPYRNTDTLKADRIRALIESLQKDGTPLTDTDFRILDALVYIHNPDDLIRTLSKIKELNKADQVSNRLLDLLTDFAQKMEDVQLLQEIIMLKAMKRNNESEKAEILAE